MQSIDRLNSVPDYYKFPVYNGDDLELTYTPDKCFFKIWSPTASEVVVKLYKSGNRGKAQSEVNMIRDIDGTWAIEIDGNWEGFFYTFEVKVGDVWLYETPGIYAKSCSINGKRAAIVDLNKTNPKGWEDDILPPFKSITDAIIYELHIRDFTMHHSSGAKNRGKFLGACESGTKNMHLLPTGIDHLSELGITHVHLMPIYDFMSVDESKNFEGQYNWGYDPDNYNVPEGSYAVKSGAAAGRIKELKQLIFELHKRNIRVVMDVVYNHTGHTLTSNFNKVVPGYYYRFNWDGTYSNASGCGNETASERPMVRKYILDSVMYWAKEYHIDGFRFDLMGIHDIDTVNLIRQKLHEYNPSIIVYGEGWTAADSPLLFQDRAVKQNIGRINNIALFNDNFRDAIKGPWWNEREGGFVSGHHYLRENIKQGVVAAVPHHQINYYQLNYDNETWAKEPYKTINYVSCHDNYTFWDKLTLTCPESPEYDVIQMQKLGLAIVLTSQGVPFLHAGSEMLRTKKGVENSYNAPDNINAIDWERKTKYKYVCEYVQGLIHLRRNHPAFRMTSTESINKHLRFIETCDDSVVAYELSEFANNDRWKRIVVIYNSKNQYHRTSIPIGKWIKVVDANRVNERGIEMIEGDRVDIAPISTLVLVGN